MKDRIWTLLSKNTDPILQSVFSWKNSSLFQKACGWCGFFHGVGNGTWQNNGVWSLHPERKQAELRQEQDGLIAITSNLQADPSPDGCTRSCGDPLVLRRVTVGSPDSEELLKTVSGAGGTYLPKMLLQGWTQPGKAPASLEVGSAERACSLPTALSFSRLHTEPRSSGSKQVRCNLRTAQPEMKAAIKPAGNKPGLSKCIYYILSYSIFLFAKYLKKSIQRL